MLRPLLGLSLLAACVPSPGAPPASPGGAPGAGGGVGATPGVTQPILAAPWTPPDDGTTTPGDPTPTPPATPAGLAAARTFTFTAETSGDLGGDSTVARSDFGCDGTIHPGDRLGRIAVVATFFQNACYTDGRYNARNFPAEGGVVVASDGARYEAYRLHPPRQAPSDWLGSRHLLAYAFPSAEAYTIYTLEQGAAVVVAQVAAGEVVAGGHTPLTIDATALAGPAVYFALPSSQPLSSLAAIGDRAAGAVLARGDLGPVELYRYAVDGTPFDTRTGYAEGPASHRNIYGRGRTFFPVELAGGVLGVIWQDAATKAAWITTIDASLTQQRTTSVANPGGDVLAAATSDGGTAAFLLFVQDGNGAGVEVARATRLVRADLATGATAEAALDAGPQGLNITVFEDDNVASLAYAGGRLGLMIGRTMHRSGDGLNHQGGIAVVLDPTTLAVVQNHGQTSGHSFENVLTTRGGDFVGIDLGDNYPRGVHLHTFAERTRESAVVFTFKTEHGQQGRAPDGRTWPSYPEISGATSYYKWSNDNATYTELGGVVADAAGYTVVFASEPRGGRALDNARVGETLNDPRNIGLVRVGADFPQHSTYGNVVTDAMVRSPGAAEDGGFYTFGGTWSAQRNAGVVWLTHYQDLARGNASRVRAVGLGDGHVLILWEEWTPSAYVTTWGVKVDVLGNRLTRGVELGPAVRLGRRDDLLVRGNDVYVIAGRGAERALDVVRLRVP